MKGLWTLTILVKLVKIIIICPYGTPKYKNIGTSTTSVSYGRLSVADHTVNDPKAWSVHSPFEYKPRVYK